MTIANILVIGAYIIPDYCSVPEYEIYCTQSRKSSSSIFESPVGSEPMAWQTDYGIMKEGMSILRGRKSIPGISNSERENGKEELHQLMVQSAEALKLKAPDLYVRQSSVPNPYTLAINGKKPFVVVHTSLITLLSRKELQAVLAHELGHLLLLTEPLADGVLKE
nr:peptidase family M48 family protein [Tanacetum cinerariifolium]